MTKDNFIGFIVVQAILIALFGGLTEYGPTATPGAAVENSLSYPMFQDVHVMIFIGFGFLMTFLKRYAFSALGVTFLLASVAVQWAMLCLGFFHRLHPDHSWSLIQLDLNSLINADFAAGAVLISFGAVIGKLSPTQLLVMTILEVIAYAANESVVYLAFKATDVGGSMVIHTFGAYFGLAVAYFCNPHNIKDRVALSSSRYDSDVSAMIGTIFLWLFWPSFNAAPAQPGAPQTRVIINTYLSLAVCCVTTSILSRVLRGHGKFDMVDIQNATLAGGVAMGASADLVLRPYGAMLIGFSAAVVSSVGFVIIMPYLLERGFHDTCGVHNLHGMPGVLGGIVSAIAAGAATASTYGPDLGNIFPQRSLGRTGAEQAGYQMAALGTSLGFGLVCGALTGLLLRSSLFQQPVQLFDDSEYWGVPDDEKSYQPPTKELKPLGPQSV